MIYSGITLALAFSTALTPVMASVPMCRTQFVAQQKSSTGPTVIGLSREYRSKEIIELEADLNEIKTNIRSVDLEIKSLERKIKSADDDSDGFDFSDWISDTMGDHSRGATPYSTEEDQKKLAILEGTIAKMKTQRTSLTEKLKVLKQKQQPDLLKALKAQITETPANLNVVNELLRFSSLTQIDANLMLTLSVGNPKSNYSKAEIDSLKQLVHSAVKMGYLIAYDADSSLGQFIAAEGKDRALGISAFESKEKGIMTIANHYLRLAALSHASRKLVTSDSITGAALMVNNDASVVVTPQNLVSLRDWAAQDGVGNRKLGIDFSRLPNIRTFSEALFLEVPSRDKTDDDDKTERFLEKLEEPPKPPQTAKVKDVAYNELLTILNHLNIMSNGLKATLATGGAAVFGSSSLDEKSIPKNYSVSYLLASKGVPITTGGAGGAMKVANKAAYDAGALSIGIPIGGRNQLKNETKVASDSQTSTIVVSDYVERIPLLLDNKELVVIVPGGGGTMRELAALLVKAAGEPTSHQQVFLLDVEYYSGLNTWFKALDLPKELKNRVHLIDSAEQADALLAQLIQTGQIKSENFFKTPDNRPRTSNKAFDDQKQN